MRLFWLGFLFVALAIITGRIFKGLLVIGVALGVFMMIVEFVKMIALYVGLPVLVIWLAWRWYTRTQRQPTVRGQAAVSYPAVGLGPFWCYRINDREYGPVDDATMQDLVQTGRVPLDTLVRSASANDWIPARRRFWFR